MAKYTHIVEDVKRNTKHTFKSLKKAKDFIENWGLENDHHTGKIDIDKNTIMWNVGTFKDPILQYTRSYNFKK